MIEALADKVPGLVGGGADLTGNTGTVIEETAGSTPPGTRGPPGPLGVREHGMGGVMNGTAAHGGVIPVGGTFFVFSDYARPAVRLAAMSDYKVVFAFTHDSVGLGEDGPTHQPIEHLALAAGDAPAAADPPGRRQRDRPGLAHRPVGGPTTPCSPARTCRSWRARPGPPSSRGLTPWPTREATSTWCSSARAARSRCVDAAGRLAEDGLPGWCLCRRGTCSPSRATTTRTSCCRRTCRPSPSRPGQLRLGPVGPTTA